MSLFDLTGQVAVIPAVIPGLAAGKSPGSMKPLFQTAHAPFILPTTFARVPGSLRAPG